MMASKNPRESQDSSEEEENKDEVPQHTEALEDGEPLPPVLNGLETPSTEHDSRTCYSEREGSIQQAGPSVFHSPGGGIRHQLGDNQNSSRTCFSERGCLITQDSGPSGRHSPVGGIECHPEELQEEVELLAEPLFIGIFLYLLTK
ncbi:uncharacterized protein LOC144631463 [Oculina patagonica]